MIFIKTLQKILKQSGSFKLSVGMAINKTIKQKVYGLNEGELGGKIVTEFLGLSANTDSYLIDDSSENKNN